MEQRGSGSPWLLSPSQSRLHLLLLVVERAGLLLIVGSTALELRSRSLESPLHQKADIQMADTQKAHIQKAADNQSSHSPRMALRRSSILIVAVVVAADAPVAAEHKGWESLSLD